MNIKIHVFVTRQPPVPVFRVFSRNYFQPNIALQGIVEILKKCNIWQLCCVSMRVSNHENRENIRFFQCCKQYCFKRNVWKCDNINNSIVLAVWFRSHKQLSFEEDHWICYVNREVPCWKIQNFSTISCFPSHYTLITILLDDSLKPQPAVFPLVSPSLRSVGPGGGLPYRTPWIFSPPQTSLENMHC